MFSPEQSEQIPEQKPEHAKSMLYKRCLSTLNEYFELKENRKRMKREFEAAQQRLISVETQYFEKKKELSQLIDKDDSDEILEHKERRI